MASARPRPGTRPAPTPRRRRCRRRAQRARRPPARAPRGTRARYRSAPRVVEGPDLDRECRRARYLCRPAERGIEVRHIDDGDATEELLPLDEWPVGEEHFVILESRDGRRARRVEPAGEHPPAGGFDLAIDAIELTPHSIEHLPRWDAALRLIEAEYILRHKASGWIAIASRTDSLPCAGASAG